MNYKYFFIEPGKTKKGMQWDGFDVVGLARLLHYLEPTPVEVYPTLRGMLLAVTRIAVLKCPENFVDDLKELMNNFKYCEWLYMHELDVEER